MLSSPFFLRRFGNKGFLFIAMAVIGLRNLLYAGVTDPTQILLVQVFHGLTSPLVWIAGVNFVAEKAPRGLNATAQGMFATTLLGIGTASRNLLSGILIDGFGIRGMFSIVGNYHARIISVHASFSEARFRPAACISD